MTQTTPHATRSATGNHSHWTRDGQTTYCGRPTADLLPEVAAEINTGRRDVSCRHCQRHSQAVWRVLAR